MLCVCANKHLPLVREGMSFYSICRWSLSGMKTRDPAR